MSNDATRTASVVEESSSGLFRQIAYFPVLLLSISIWATIELVSLAPSRGEPSPPPASPPAPQPVSVVSPLPISTAPTDGIDADDRYNKTGPGGLGRQILNNRVDQLDIETLTTREVRLADVFAKRTVTVVNLFATWCQPCKEEFPGFQALFRQGRDELQWGQKVRFATILIHDDTVKLRKAYEDFEALMPRVDTFLGARQHHGLGEQLGQRALLAADGTVPATFVLDCRRQVLWNKIGVLSAADFDELRELVSRLKANLDSQKLCPRPEPLAKPKSIASCNYNGVCEPKRGESPFNCTRDCTPDLD